MCSESYKYNYINGIIQFLNVVRSGTISQLQLDQNATVGTVVVRTVLLQALHSNESLSVCHQYVVKLRLHCDRRQC